MPSRNILDFVYGGSHFSTGVIFLRVRHVKNRPLWHFFFTWDTFFYGQGSFLYDEEWPLGRFSTGVVIRRYSGTKRCRRTKEVGPTVGAPSHRHFVWLSNVPVQAPTRGQPLDYGYYEKPSHLSRLLRRAWGYGGSIRIFNPLGPHGGINSNVFLFIILL